LLQFYVVYACNVSRTGCLSQNIIRVVKKEWRTKKKYRCTANNIEANYLKCQTYTQKHDLILPFNIYTTLDIYFI